MTSSRSTLVPTEVLREAARARVASTSRRAFAAEAGISYGALTKFLAGSEPYSENLRKLTEWYMSTVEKINAATAHEEALSILVREIPSLERGTTVDKIINLRPGRTGNEVLAAARTRMRAEAIDGTIYTHPIGAHGHGAGPLIGLWDRQEGVPGRGDVALRPNTWFSIELQATTPVPEWNGQPVRMGLEEEARLDEGGARHWVLRRQEGFHLVR